MPCGCTELCNCAVQAGDCTTVVGDGRSVSPYQIGVEISPDANNGVECRANGLWARAAVNVADTDCIDMEGDGTPGDPITATPIISSDPKNRLECRPTGLYAETCPDIYCCCLIEEGPFPGFDTPDTTYDLAACTVDVPDGTCRIQVEYVIQLSWDPNQGGAPIDLSLSFIESECTLPDVLNFNCGTPSLSTIFRTGLAGPPFFREQDQLVLMTTIDITGPVSVVFTPQIITGPFHTATVAPEGGTQVYIVGEVPDSQPDNLCTECVTP